MGWIEDAFRWIMFCLDKIVYSVIGMLYELFMTISNIAVIGQDTISEFTQRIYILIGIFMIFKITISMISWYANPDSISDSKSGSGALIKRIVISLVCLAIVPWIFTFAYRIQYVILHENIIGNLVLAGMTTTDPNEAIKNGGNIMAIRTFQGFFYPNNYVAGSDYDTAMSSTSWSSASKFIHENINTKDNGEYRYHYQAFVSTLAGGFVAWILLIFCIDIAIRSVKLAFLQLIAPIPVLSYIDQKKGDKIFILESEYEIEHNIHSGYATNLETVVTSDYDSKILSRKLQIKPYYNDAEDPLYAYYRNYITEYTINDDFLDVAFGEQTLANIQFGEGGAPQYYIKKIDELISKGCLQRGKCIKLKNTKISFDEYDCIMEKLGEIKKGVK